MFKICKKCKKEFSFSEFYKDSANEDGHKIYCKTCANDYYKEWRNSKLEEVRRKDRINHYIRKYNLEKNVAEALVDNRTGICVICKTEDLLVVDHNHVTGKVRGFICSSCNSALGYSRENIEILQNLIEYLKHDI